LNLKEEFYRILLKLFYRTRLNIEVNYKDFNPKRTDPYILIGNHTSTHDGIIASMYLKKPPLPVINAFMFVNKPMKFVLTKLYPSIPKRKGQSDITTVKNMMKVIDRGRGVLIFPEGNASYYGEGSEFSDTTVKFIKKMGKDLVILKTNGAYLTAPRWGDKMTRNGLIEVNFHTLFKGEELKNLTCDEIYEAIKEEISFNDFEWNRKRQYLYKPKKRALGLERFIYLCPKCNSYQTISTKGNKIFCKNCGEIAHFNDKSFIEGLEFDNLVEWGRLQQKELPRIAKDNLYTYGMMYEVDTTEYISYEIGDVDIELIGIGLYVQHRFKEYSFDLGLIKGLALTVKDEVSFDYEEKTYMFKMKDPMLFYDVIKYKIGG